MLVTFPPLYLLNCMAFLISAHCIGARISALQGHHGEHAFLMEWGA